MGGSKKVRVTSVKHANITHSTTGKTERVEIKDIIENTANPHYVRRDIITKGCVILTDKGKAKVISRPGQDGCVNAVLLEELEDG